MDDFLLNLSVMLVPGLFAITCHEVSHGYVAWHFGDPTARMLGRLTLNPLKHLDPIGTLMIFIIHIGWAKPVPVVFENLRNPKRDMIWVAAAGPITNILLAAFSAGLLRAVMFFGKPVSMSPLTFIIDPLVKMLAFSVLINLVLAIFNMIPLPPLDGGRVLVGLLPHRQAAVLARIEPYGFFIIIAMVFVLPRFLRIDIFSSMIFPLVRMGIYVLAGPQSALVLRWM
jgi:Zn-dependent protease